MLTSKMAGQQFALKTNIHGQRGNDHAEVLQCRLFALTRDGHYVNLNITEHITRLDLVRRVARSNRRVFQMIQQSFRYQLAGTPI
jgi:hypothetical protein